MTRIRMATLALALVPVPTETSQNTTPGLPTRLERYVTTVVRLTADERRRLTGGAPVTKLNVWRLPAKLLCLSFRL